MLLGKLRIWTRNRENFISVWLESKSAWSSIKSQGSINLQLVVRIRPGRLIMMPGFATSLSGLPTWHGAYWRGYETWIRISDRTKGDSRQDACAFPMRTFPEAPYQPASAYIRFRFHAIHTRFHSPVPHRTRAGESVETPAPPWRNQISFPPWTCVWHTLLCLRGFPIVAILHL